MLVDMINSTRFLGAEFASEYCDSAFVVIPVPFERTVSYGTGTAAGPAAILAASEQVETFDGAGCPYESGIHTLPAIDCSEERERVFGSIREVFGKVVADGKIPVGLGGEHSITPPIVEAFAAAGRRFGVVQFDAHADLRDEYEGDRHSHACAARRILDLGIPLLQIGVRSMSREEHGFRMAGRVSFIDAETIAARGFSFEDIPTDFPEEIYVTLDLDALDPSIIPATGTPEPGGLDWYVMKSIFAMLVESRKVIGLDAVELAPIKGLHVADFAAARLIHDCLGAISRRC